MPAPNLDQTLKSLRILQSVFLFTVAMYVYAAHVVVRENPRPLDPVMFGAMAVLAVFVLLASFVARSKLIAPALERLRMAPDDLNALQGWRRGVIFANCLTECVVLFGFALWVLGGSVRQVALFAIVPIVVFILTFPQRP